MPRVIFIIIITRSPITTINILEFYLLITINYINNYYFYRNRH